MSEATPVDILIEAADDALRTALRTDQVGAMLDAVIRAARLAHPMVVIDPVALAAFIGERLSADLTALRSHLSRLESSDIALAWACSVGQHAALTRFSALFDPVIQRTVVQLCRDPALADDVAQSVMEQVLFGRNGKAAKIGQFLGRGRLVDWLRTVTRREALQHLRVRGRMVEFEDSGPLESGDAITDMELGHLQQVYRDQFREAFAEAMASLSPKERVILRFKVIDGLNIEQIGRMNGVHRATVARWLAAARRKLLKQTRARLMHDAGLSPSEFESVTRLVRSQLDLSVGRLLDAPS